MRNLCLTFSVLWVALSNLTAQHACSTYDYIEYIKQNDPLEYQNIKQAQSLLDQGADQNLQQKSAQSTSCGSNYIIPIVFHVLHNNGSENLSDETIHEQVRRLNLDFNKQNADTSEVIDAFKSIIGNAGFEFRLARIDPFGNPTTGIVRYETTQTTDAPSFSSPWTDNRQWPRSKYLNVYTGRTVGEGIGGFTYLPAWMQNNPENDAIFCRADVIGFDERTLTHEIGHWLNLDHLWGGSNDPGLPDNCFDDDGVFDTPNTVGWSSCNLSGESCSSLDNIQNYMEYSFCNAMFTEGQALRMQNTLNSSISDRNNLSTQSNLNATGVSQLVEVRVDVDKKIVCRQDTVLYQDFSEYGVCDRTWSFSGASPSSSIEPKQEVLYDQPGLYDVLLQVSNTQNTLSALKQSFVLVVDPQQNFLPYQESFEADVIPSNKWMVDEDQYPFQINSTVGYQSTSSVSINNFSSTTEQTSTLYSSGLDLSPMLSATMTYKVAYAQKQATDQDALRLLISSDCGNTWLMRSLRLGPTLKSVEPQTAAFVPSSDDDWKSFTASIPNFFLKEGFQFKFEFTGKGGNNIYIDDINITGIYKNTVVLSDPQTNAQDVILQPTLDFKSVDQVEHYILQLDTAADFSSALLQEQMTDYIDQSPNNTDTEFEVSSNLLPQTTYYWRAAYITGQDTSQWSDVWNFTTGLDIPTSTSLMNKSELKVFPNPFKEQLFISGLTPSSKIRLFDNLGAVVVEQPTNSNQVTLSTQKLSKGIYYLNVVDQHNQRLLIQKLVK